MKADLFHQPPRREDPNLVGAMKGLEVGGVPRDQGVGRAGNGDLQERNIIFVPEPNGNGCRGYGFAGTLQVTKHLRNIFSTESELGAPEHFTILRQDTVIV
jgi:hypothetical protein